MMTVQLSALASSETEIRAGQKATAMRNLSLEHSEPLEFDRPEVMVAASSASAAEQSTSTAYVIRYVFSPAVAK